MSNVLEWSCPKGKVRFIPIGPRQRSIVLEFEPGAGKMALDLCREALEHLFTHTDTLIVRGWIEKSNAKSRAFGSALGFSTKNQHGLFVEKRLTIARWRMLNGK